MEQKEIDKKLIETYLKGFREKREDIFQKEEYDSMLQQAAYRLGRTHATQDVIRENKQELLKNIHNLYLKTNFSPL